MGFFWSMHRHRIDVAVQELCGLHADLLAIDLADITAAALRHGLGRAVPDLCLCLVEAAIERDVHRLIDLFRVSGGTTMPPPRLVADWAHRLGLPPRSIASVAGKSAVPPALAREYLKLGRIDVAQRDVLQDVAAAYGADPKAALIWIEAAVSAEIDRYVETARPQGSWWRRLAGSQPR